MAVANLGANKTPPALKRAGKCLGILHKLTCSFDYDLGVSDIIGTHTFPGSEKDMNLIIQELIDNKVFHQNKERQYHCIDLYSGMQINVISTIDKDTLKKWMVEHIDSLRNKLYV